MLVCRPLASLVIRALAQTQGVTGSIPVRSTIVPLYVCKLTVPIVSLLDGKVIRL